MGCDAAFFLVKGDEHAATVLGLDTSTRAQMASHGAIYAQDLLPVKRAALAARGVAYIPWHGRIVAAVMLGRRRKGFSRQELSLIESLFPALGLARAAYGLPPLFDPLPSPPSVNPLRRLALGRGARVLASVQTQRGTIAVRDRAGFREMVASDGLSELVWTPTALEDSTRSGWPYVDLLHLAPALAKRRRLALFIGSGGVVSLRQFAASYPGIALDVVEREPAVMI